MKLKLILGSIIILILIFILSCINQGVWELLDLQYGVPIAEDDTITTLEDTAVDIDVLSNDVDPNKDPLSIIAVNPGSNGSTSINTGLITYTPDLNFNGMDTFSYTLSDGNGGIDTARVTVTITPVNDNPVAVNDNASTIMNVPVYIDVLANDSDVDGDTIEIDWVNSPFYGTAVIVSNTVYYTPEADSTHTDEFTYAVSDIYGDSAYALITVTVY